MHEVMIKQGGIVTFDGYIVERLLKRTSETERLHIALIDHVELKKHPRKDFYQLEVRQALTGIYENIEVEHYSDALALVEAIREALRERGLDA